MTTQKEYMQRYNAAAQSLGEPLVKRFATLVAAKNRTEALEAKVNKRSEDAQPKAKAKKTEKVAAKAVPTSAPAPIPAAPYGRGGRRRPSQTAKIKILVDKNPHRDGCKNHGRFKQLVEGGTVADHVAKGIIIGYLNYAERRNILRME